MKILGIEHLAIAVENIDDSAPFWSHILKIPHRKTEVVESEGVTTDIYDTGRGKVELLESLGEDSPINNFLKKRGPGIHHVCFEVEDINSAIKELKENNISVLSEDAKRGAEGYKIVFIHPKAPAVFLLSLLKNPSLSYLLFPL